MNLGILFGGNSLEHEISIVSAYGLRKKLIDKHNVTMIYIDFNNQLYDASKVEFMDFKNNKIKKLKKVRFKDSKINRKKIDCIILCMHGENGEDGLAAALCRFYKIPFVGSDILASSIAIDKFVTYQFLSQNGILMIKTVSYTYNDYLSGKDFDDFPCIIKPAKGGSSIGIFVCHNKDEFQENILKAFTVSNSVIIQPYYDNIVEYNLALYEDGESRLERIVKKDEIFSFANKYNDSFKIMHQALEDERLKERFKTIGRKAYELLQAKGIIRIDFFLIDETIYLNEVNIIPGALAMYLFEDFDSVINRCINNAIANKASLYKKGNFLIKSDIYK